LGGTEDEALPVAQPRIVELVASGALALVKVDEQPRTLDPVTTHPLVTGEKPIDGPAITRPTWISIEVVR